MRPQSQLATARRFNPLKQFEVARPFTESEAWTLFRIAAIAEAVGWTLLIAGIAIEHYTGDHTAVTVAGRTHGMLFFGYLAASLVLYPSLGWGRWKALFALAFSVPPYGSLVFERWSAYKRSANGFKNYRHYLVYTALVAAH